ncbi:MAG: cohesin domain-containing protein [Acidobacteria bacterium]|nr:cohesin domain-containing protein [Acidobacteriota bacterium]
MPLPRAAVLVALGLVACDGGSGSPTAPAPRVPRGVSFLAGQAGDESIGLRGTVLGPTLEVEIYAAGVQDLYGLGFELLFPANLLRYEGVDDGVFPSLEAQESASGQLVVGATHLGSVAGLNGGGTVAVVRFTAFANGSGSLDFSSQEAFDRFGDRLALSWVGGSVEVDL